MPLAEANNRRHRRKHVSPHASARRLFRPAGAFVRDGD